MLFKEYNGIKIAEKRGKKGLDWLLGQIIKDGLLVWTTGRKERALLTQPEAIDGKKCNINGCNNT